MQIEDNLHVMPKPFSGKKSLKCRMLKFITKTRLYTFDPLKPHFYIVKLGFTGVYIILLISAQKHRLWVFVRTASARRFKRAPTIYVLSRNIKNIWFFCLKIFNFSVINFSVYLNRYVFVMLLGVQCVQLRFIYAKQKENIVNVFCCCSFLRKVPVFRVNTVIFFFVVLFQGSTTAWAATA